MTFLYGEILLIFFLLITLLPICIIWSFFDDREFDKLIKGDENE